MWDFFPEDLTLIKPVDEDQKDAAQAESINQDQCCSECCCDASGVEASFESSVVDGSGLEITYKLAPIEFACKCGDVSLRFDYSNPNAIEVKGGSMSFEVARESLESLVTCLTCLRDELRLKRGVDECGAIQTVVR
jgi:hypothetical protein